MTERHGVAAVTAAVLCSSAALALTTRGTPALEPAGTAASVALVGLLAWSVSQALEQVEPRKAAFNVATAACTAGAMAFALQQLADVPLLVALGVAHVTGWAVNHLALLAVLTAAGLRRDVVQRAGVQRWAVQGVVSGGLGLLLALAWVQTHVAVLLFVVPLAALHAAGRALVRAAAERRRLAGTAAASRVLSSGSTGDLPGYLEHLRAAFGAQACWLQHDGSAGASVGTVQAPLEHWLRALPGLLPDDQPRRFPLALPETVEVLAVRLGADRGVLAVVDPRGERDSSRAELATTAAAAREAAAFVEAQRVRELAEHEHLRLEAVMRSVADGIVTVADDGRVLSFNPAAAAITGLTPDVALSGRTDALALTTPEGDVWWPRPGMRVDGVRLQLRAHSGSPRHLDVSASPALVDGVDCAVLVLRDVTARVEQERAREQFVVGLGHELRTPLTPLLGWARTLRRRPDLLDGPQRDHMVHALDTESARLARLVDNLLTAVDPSALVSARATVDLVELVDQRLRVARPQLLGRTVTVTAEGPATVTTSVAAVGQVLDNLLSNVARYTPAGSPVHVRVGLAGGAALVEVADTGPGVPAALREDIFGLFVRGGSEEANPGVGMGLAVSRSLARSLGGDLVCGDRETADGDARTGAAFRLLLPVHVVPRPHGEPVVSPLFAT